MINYMIMSLKPHTNSQVSRDNLAKTKAKVQKMTLDK